MGLPNAARDTETLSAGARAQALVVSRNDLATAHEKARSVSRRLHRIEDLADLDWEEMNDLCRALHQTEMLLRGMLEVAPGGAAHPYVTPSSQGENGAKETGSEKREQWA